MNFLDTNKSRGWLVGICLVVVIVMTTWNRYGQYNLGTTVDINKTAINRINDLLKLSALRQDTFYGSLRLLQARKTQVIYNTLKIENDHKIKIAKYNLLDTSQQLQFLTDWIKENE